MHATPVIHPRAKRRRKRRLRYEMAASAAHEPVITLTWESVLCSIGKRIATPFCRTVRNDRSCILQRALLLPVPLVFFHIYAAAGQEGHAFGLQ